MRLKKTETEIRVLFIHYARLLFRGLNLKDIAFLEGINVNTISMRLRLIDINVRKIKCRLKNVPYKPYKPRGKPVKVMDSPVQNWDVGGIKDSYPGSTVYMFGGKYANK